MFEPSPNPRVHGLAPGVDFPRAVIDGLLARLEGQPPEALARVHLVVNTRRMARRMQAMFEAGAPRLLPRISLVTDLAALPGAPVPPPAVPPLRRRLELVGLVSRLLDSKPGLAPRSSLYGLSDSLAALMEEMSGEGITAETLRRLDVTDQSGHWENALSFFTIAQDYIDQTATAPDTEARNRAVVETLAARWAVAPPATPIVLAGSTGSRGTTNLLMQAVARLPQGAVILPGFDFDMPGRTWDRLENALSGEDHPQYRFRSFLAELEMAAAEVTLWHRIPAPCPARNRLVSLALRPAPVTHEWLAEGPGLDDIATATEGLTLVEAPGDRAEALVIAMRLRQAAEDGQSAALITPDRMLTRRVTAALDRWGILPDDSAGTPLQLSPPGRFLRQVAELGRRPVSAEALVSLLKHPLAHSGADRNDHLLHTRAFELWTRRKGPPFPGAGDLRRFAKDAEVPDAWVTWVCGLLDRVQPPARADLATRLEQTLGAAAFIAAGAGAEGTGGLWAEKAGREAHDLMTALSAEADAGGPISHPDFADLLGSILATGEVRDRDAPHPGILIWGTLEARVQGADLLILAGLNEGSWPEMPSQDPWLNRALRAQAGLLLPDRRIGLAAHDFQQAVAARDVWLTRSVRSDDAQTVPARWLNRICNLLDGLPDQGGRTALADMRARGAAWLARAEALELPAPVVPARRPAPVPPEGARPDRLSVTQVETLIRDPYAVYARRVLGLARLNPLARDPDPALRGTIVHKILEDFITAVREDPTALNAETLLGIADRHLQTDVPWPSARVSWKARLERVATDFLTKERIRQQSVAQSALEVEGRTVLTDPPFTLTGAADRIDLAADGGAMVYDYKTGTPPNKNMQAHFAKQLLLEAAMIEAGDFRKIGARRVIGAKFLQLGTKYTEVAAPLEDEPSDVVWSKFRALITAYVSGDKGFVSRRAPKNETYTGDYDQLARFGEWDMTDTPRREDLA